MKIIMFGTIMFQVDVDMETIRTLKVLAQNHYDGACKQTAEPRGILSIWERTIEFRPPERVNDETYWPRATFRELDTLSKVCESNSLWHSIHKDDAARARVSKFAKQIGNALRTAHNYTKGWTHKFEELSHSNDPQSDGF